MRADRPVAAVEPVFFTLTLYLVCLLSSRLSSALTSKLAAAPPPPVGVALTTAESALVPQLFTAATLKSNSVPLARPVRRALVPVMPVVAAQAEAVSDFQ